MKSDIVKYSVILKSLKVSSTKVLRQGRRLSDQIGIKIFDDKNVSVFKTEW